MKEQKLSTSLLFRQLNSRMNIQDRSEVLKSAWTFASYFTDEDDLDDNKYIIDSYFEQQQRTDIQRWCPFTPGDLVIDNNNRKGVVVSLVAGYHTIDVYFEGETKAETILVSLLSSLDLERI